MRKKFTDKTNGPLLYISQPSYTETKAIMQQSYVVRPTYNEEVMSPLSVRTKRKVDSDEELKERAVADEVEKAASTTEPSSKAEVKEIAPKSEKAPDAIPEAKAPIKREIPIPLKSETRKSNRSRIQTFNRFQTFGSLKPGLSTPKTEPTAPEATKLPEPAAPESSEPIRNEVSPSPKAYATNSEPVAEPVKAETTPTILPKETKAATPNLNDTVSKSLEQLSQPEATASNSNEEVVEEAKPKRSMVTGIIKSSFELGQSVKTKKQERIIEEPEIVEKAEIELSKTENTEVVSSEEQVAEQENVETQEEQVETKVKKKRPFRELDIHEKVEYLLNIPSVVPKTKCEFKTKEESHIGIVEKFEDDIVHIIRMKKPNRIQVKLEDIIAINRVSF